MGYPFCKSDLHGPILLSILKTFFVYKGNNLSVHRTYHMSDEFKEKMDTGLSKSYHLDFFINLIVLDFYWSDPPKSLEVRTFNIFLQ